MEAEGHWQTCVVDPDYEIDTEYPYSIRRKLDGYIVKESISNRGYYQCSLNGVTYPKHRIIAFQFIPNDAPEIKTQVDHIYRNKLNNDISNLRWCSPSENTKNRSSVKGYNYEFVDNIDEECILVDTYNNHTFEDYYYDAKTDIFYFFTGVNFR